VRGLPDALGLGIYSIAAAILVLGWWTIICWPELRARRVSLFQGLLLVAMLSVAMSFAAYLLRVMRAGGW
jgi:hypothetical protein